MTTQHIIGTLKSAHPKAVTKRTYKHIYKAVTENKLYGIVFAENWEEGILTLDNHTPNVTPVDCPSPLEFITRLTQLINAEGVIKLKLQGVVTVMVPRINPIVFRLVVQDGKIHSQQATLLWDEEIHQF